MDNILLDDLEDESDDEYVYDGNDGGLSKHIVLIH